MPKTSSGSVAQFATFYEPTSLKDFAVRQSSQVLLGKDLAKWFIHTYPDFPKGFEKGDDALKKELFEGYQVTYANTDGGRVKEYGYVEINGSKHYVQITPDMEQKPKEVEKIGVHYAMSLTGQAFGAMEDKEKKEVIGKVRKGFSKYASNCYSKLLSNITEVQNEGKPRERKATEDFIKRVEVALSNFDKAVGVALLRGDTTAHKDAHKQATKAYLNKYKEIAKLK
jgi:hypothetical protein